VPLTATISNVSLPEGYTGGYWEYTTSTTPAVAATGESLLPGYEWFNMHAVEVDAPYPVNTTVTFNFRVDNVALGLTPGNLYTYWDDSAPANYPYWMWNQAYYSGFSTSITGPVSLPEPSTIALLAIGAISLIAWRRRRTT
jgi:hypothetical protein